ncbi:nuclear transport factor 2 family protein [Gordonia neofelifaecis]|uniref:SnoaL-like domain-containing protein n=1 Tax=Gordonia neofelifaecis NRRL B-59395 TaxID=644548 RepID=F1YFL8_9ACTN|nr:nuclear transport factor 2 family protein [Gordonia neofelifaecis]EGD56402.1 hypothetical protein SCNU_02577 [Gordonia neofelifaecis NRRL B-59395]
MREFRAAVEARDEAAIEALLADDVRFTSPVAFTPYDGKHITAAILRAVMRVMGDDFEYVREFVGTDEHDHALEFRSVVAGKQISGCDFIHVNDDGRIDDLMVMVRPLSSANALAEAMGAQFDRIVAEATAAAQNDEPR